MINNSFWGIKIIGVITIMLSVSGCVNSASQVAYSSSVPIEKTCTLWLVATLTVKKFNNENVLWKATGLNSWATIQIPEGSHTFVLDCNLRQRDGYSFVANNVIVKYDKFIAGKIYEMVLVPGGTHARIGIKDATNGLTGFWEGAVGGGRGFEWLELKWEK